MFIRVPYERMLEKLMKSFRKSYVSLALLALMLAFVAGCSGSSSSTSSASTGALGLPKVEMKCNGEACIN